MAATAVEEATLSCAEIVITGRYCTCATIGMLWLATASRVAKNKSFGKGQEDKVMMLPRYGGFIMPKRGIYL